MQMQVQWKGGIALKIDYKRLRAVMALRDVSQKQLVNKTGLGRVTINSVCCGRKCSPDTARKIAEALDVELSDICEGEEGDQ